MNEPPSTSRPLTLRTLHSVSFSIVPRQPGSPLAATWLLLLHCTHTPVSAKALSLVPACWSCSLLSRSLVLHRSPILSLVCCRSGLHGHSLSHPSLEDEHVSPSALENVWLAGFLPAVTWLKQGLFLESFLSLTVPWQAFCFQSVDHHFLSKSWCPAWSELCPQGLTGH